MFTGSCDTCLLSRLAGTRVYRPGGGGGEGQVFIIMSRLGVGLLFTSSKVVPRIVVSNVFHPDLISPETVAGGGTPRNIVRQIHPFRSLWVDSVQLTLNLQYHLYRVISIMEQTSGS